MASRSLEEELASGRRFDWSEVTRIAIQTCRALKHAHDRGIVHRDIKPANLMLTAAREVKLSDFGIAKLFGAAGMTVEGGIIGTAEYMAPEQADGRAASERTDLYSLGGVMYTLLARRPPFRAKTLPEMLQLQRYAEPDPVGHFAPETPVELERIIAQLLAKEPERRLANAGVLARRLEAMIDEIADAQPSNTPTASNEFDIANAATMAAPANGDPTSSPSETMAFLPGAPSTPDPNSPTGGRLAPTVAGDGKSEHHADRTFELAPTIARQTTRVFKTVEEADQEEAEQENKEDARAFTFQTAGLVGAIALVGLFIWYMLQPPDVATLYARVEANSDSVQSLATVKGDIDLLISNYGHDLDISQRARLEGYQEELELDRMERLLDRESRRVSSKRLTPIERAYLDAIVTMRGNKAAGVRKLKALVALFGIAPETGTTTQRCLELARRQIRRIDDVMDDAAIDDAAFIERSLVRAHDYAAEDPDDARRICEGILETYGDRPWATEILGRVQQLLDTLPPPGAAAADMEPVTTEPAEETKSAAIEEQG